MLHTIFRLSFAFCLGSLAHAQSGSRRYPPLYPEAADFADAIRSQAADTGAPCTSTGLIVPHHIVARDLIAAGFARVASCRFRRVIVLFPDHFQRAEKPFATTGQGFETALGPVDTDTAAADVLLARGDLVEGSDLFARDHGIGSLAPFIRHYLPQAKVLPVAISGGSQPNDWDALSEVLRPLLGPDTLLVQSTDFSHYLDAGTARLRDQQVLNVIAAGDLAAAARLTSPAHLNSVGALYLQMKLQNEVYGASPAVIANRNSQSYFARRIERTTSYVVGLYHTDRARIVDPVDGARHVCFAGDTSFGRGVAAAFGTGEAHRAKVGEIEARLRGCPLIFNLAGVILPEPLANPRPAALSMSPGQVGDWFRELHVMGVDIANNHARDFGRAALDAMRQDLRRRGLAVLDGGVVVEMESFRIVALSDGDNHAGIGSGLIRAGDVEALAHAISAAPLFAFLHWGEEFSSDPTERQRALAGQLQEAGVSLILGAGSHLASPRPELLAGGEALALFSLGNFLFDQSGDATSGSVAVVTLFPQGTFFASLLPIGTGAPPLRQP